MDLSRPDHDTLGPHDRDAERDADIGDPQLRRFLDRTFQADQNALHEVIDVEERLRDLHRRFDQLRDATTTDA